MSYSFLGFAPGFAYMTGGFALPGCGRPGAGARGARGRRRLHRDLPAATPGGWRLLGRVAARMFEPGANPRRCCDPETA